MWTNKINCTFLKEIHEHLHSYITVTDEILTTRKIRLIQYEVIAIFSVDQRVPMSTCQRSFQSNWNRLLRLIQTMSVSACVPLYYGFWFICFPICDICLNHSFIYFFRLFSVWYIRYRMNAYRTHTGRH